MVVVPQLLKASADMHGTQRPFSIRKRDFNCCSNCRSTVASVPVFGLNGLLKEKKEVVSVFAAKLKETPVAKKRVVLQRLTEVVDLLKSDNSLCYTHNRVHTQCICVQMHPDASICMHMHAHACIWMECIEWVLSGMHMDAGACRVSLGGVVDMHLHAYACMCIHKCAYACRCMHMDDDMDE